MSGDPKTAIVVVGMACRVPGADSVEAFADMLFNGRTGYRRLPADRCDRSLYFDPQKGKAGKSYTTLGGTVPERPLNRDLCPLSTKAEQLFDACMCSLQKLPPRPGGMQNWFRQDCATHTNGRLCRSLWWYKIGGGLSLGDNIEEVCRLSMTLNRFISCPLMFVAKLLPKSQRPFDATARHVNPCAAKFPCVSGSVVVRKNSRPDGTTCRDRCRRASSLVALAQAMLAIKAGASTARLSEATYNNIDNLILFSHSQACTATDSRPFDDHASGLVSSEGYVAIVIMTQAKAIEHDLPILGVIRGVGMASDGKGRSLWAPRMEGQVLALQRAYGEEAPLDIDYLEAHATSTQLGDAR